MARARRTDATVNVKGLDQFRRELRKIQQEGGADGISLLKEANTRVANYVIAKAQAKAAGVGRMQHKAALSMRAGKQQARATIIGGGAKMPYFFGAEFGAYPGVRRTRNNRNFVGFNQFERWKRPGNGNAGYFLFPTMRDESRKIIDMYGDELDKIAATAFPD